MTGADYIARARTLKAVRLIDAIDDAAIVCGLDPVEDAALIVSVLRDGGLDWVALAVGCGVRPPSDETRAIVCEVIGRRVPRVARVA